MNQAYEQGKASGYQQGYGTANAAHWAAYQAIVNAPPQQGWIAELESFNQGFAAGVLAWKAEHPYAVLEFGSHPDLDNDDCYNGQDFATLDEARVAYLATPDADVAYLMLDGPEVNEIRANPHHRAPRRGSHDAWQREIATQAGMEGGSAAYNDAMGY
jgi:hypothetical protein